MANAADFIVLALKYNFSQFFYLKTLVLLAPRLQAVHVPRARRLQVALHVRLEVVVERALALRLVVPDDVFLRERLLIQL